MRILLRTAMGAVFWIVFAYFCLNVAAVPLKYLLADGRVGLLLNKSFSVLSNDIWRVAFYTHIICGGIALAVGWMQFIKPWRKRFLYLHRAIGKLYVLMVCSSGVASVYMAFYASGGWVAALGFGTVGILWLYFTLQAYQSIRQKDIPKHERMMIYSYSACLGAVTLRFWLPLLMGVFNLEFTTAFSLVAWLSWVPNLLVAQLIVSVTSRSYHFAPNSP